MMTWLVWGGGGPLGRPPPTFGTVLGSRCIQTARGPHTILSSCLLEHPIASVSPGRSYERGKSFASALSATPLLQRSITTGALSGLTGRFCAPERAGAGPAVRGEPPASWMPPKYDSFALSCGPAIRWLSTPSTPRLRLWIAGAPEAIPLWRQILGWGPLQGFGFLHEVLLPPTASEVDGLALGGCGILALSGGRLLGTSLQGQQEGPTGSLQLREVEAEPPEAVGVAAEVLRRHLCASEEMGIPSALGGTATGMSPQQHEERGQLRFVKMAAGLHHCAAVSSHGVLYTWGKGGSWGAGNPLGHGDSKNRRRPTPVSQVNTPYI